MSKKMLTDDGMGNSVPVNGWRRQRIAAPVHTKFTAGCPTCNQLQKSGSDVIPHIGTA